MEYILACISIEDNPTRLCLIAAVVILLFNCLWAFLDRLLLPWQTKRLLKKWKIEVKNLRVLPLLTQLKELAVNLSGTISYGAPAVTDIFPNGISSARLLALAAAIEKGIDHPVAEAIVEEACVRGLALPDVSASNPVPGKGVEALMNRQSLSLGSAAFLQEQNIDIPAELFTKADQLAYKGQIIVFVAIGKFCRGFITLHDKLKRSVPGDISFLREMGIKTTILTGANRSTAKSYSRPSTIDQIRSELDSMGKAKELLLMQTGGQVIGAAGRTMKFEGAIKSAQLSFALEYADEAVKTMADVLIHTNSLGTIATAKGICRVAEGKKKTGRLICIACNLLVILSVVFLLNLASLPAYGSLLPILLGVFAAILLIMNQIPLQY
ncbi:HAD family hydrolase [Anaerovibrio sp.]|uniref:HAD family hydrolase n=1 Tax=Anaerovibrio sp. TaxID=1872532 RepID=UPI003F18592D